jgi:hypothetical protein
MRLPVLVTALVALASARAAAADGVSEFENRPTALFVQVGVGTPVGWLGLEAERTLTPEMAISAGAGFGETGPQASLMPRFLFWGDRSKVFIGTGVSGGDYKWTKICYETVCAEKRGRVMWGNAEIGAEHRFRSGFAMRYFGGYGRVIAGDLACVGDTADDCTRFNQSEGRQIVYTGFALGGAF